MKCIKNQKKIIRVSNEEAARRVREQKGWEYCSKSAFKEAIRRNA
tara:strand:+ start:81 stop:215 length:135 start_codon:yes stop_codon:yes gene_type:complete